MELFEEAVLAYVTGPRHRFVRPQYGFTYNNGVGGSVPAFVVLDFATSTAYVVEVTAAWNVKTLIERVKCRDDRWYKVLREHLAEAPLNRITWDFHTTVFVRGDRKERVRSKLAGETRVTVIALDDIMQSWKWNWEAHAAVNPMDRDPAEAASV